MSVRSSAGNSSASTNNLAVTVPAGTVAGDVVVIWATWNSVCTLSDGGQGFTLTRQDDEATDASSCAVFVKRVTGGEGVNYTINSSATDRCALIAVTFSSVPGANTSPFSTRMIFCCATRSGGASVHWQRTPPGMPREPTAGSSLPRRSPTR